MIINPPHLILIISGATLIITATLAQMTKRIKIVLVLTAFIVWGAAVYLLLNPYVEYGYLVSL